MSYASDEVYNFLANTDESLCNRVERLVKRRGKGKAAELLAEEFEGQKTPFSNVPITKTSIKKALVAF